MDKGGKERNTKTNGNIETEGKREELHLGISAERLEPEDDCCMKWFEV